MKCSHTGASDTVESRVQKDGLRHRRRYCHVCTATFATVEVPREWVDEFEETKARLERIASALKEIA